MLNILPLAVPELALEHSHSLLAHSAITRSQINNFCWVFPDSLLLLLLTSIVILFFFLVSISLLYFNTWTNWWDNDNRILYSLEFLSSHHRWKYAFQYLLYCNSNCIALFSPDFPPFPPSFRSPSSFFHKSIKHRYTISLDIIWTYINLVFFLSLLLELTI